MLLRNIIHKTMHVAVVLSIPIPKEMKMNFFALSIKIISIMTVTVAFHQPMLVYNHFYTSQNQVHLLTRERKNYNDYSNNAFYFQHQQDHVIIYPTRRKMSTLNLLRGGASNNANNNDSKNEKLKEIFKLSKKRKKEKKHKNYTLIETTINDRQSDELKETNKRKKLYFSCILIVLLWISTGTIFYSKFNNWPLAQSFFYAVDAGMSIGFCTDVVETKIGSRAFTIVFILMGASSVGGALALFIKDIMEGAVELRNCEFEYLLAKAAFERVDKDQDGKINLIDFRDLLQNWTGTTFTEEEMDKLCSKFDCYGRRYITSTVFLEKISDLQEYLQFNGPLYSRHWLVRKASELNKIIRKQFSGRNRIFVTCLAWVAMGILWGKHRMKWDIITATHFAISALATGGLTGPPVDKNGILPVEPALFCGIFCLIGIPLFALTLAHFARALVEKQVVAEEKRTIFRSLDEKEFEFARSLCSPEDPMVHLSDYIVLQLLRMGKVDMDTINLIQTQFKMLDSDGSGKLLHSTSLKKLNSTLKKDM